MPDESLSWREPEAIAAKLGLVNHGRTSFVELCKKGCDPSFLGEHFYFITHNPTTTITPKNEKRTSFEVELRSLDTIESALARFEKRQIEALQKKIKEVLEEINKLNSSKLIGYIHIEEFAPYEAISALPPLLSYYADNFIPFILEKAKKVGSKKKPLFNFYMNSICNHVKEQTGKQQFRLICDVLNELGIGWDVDALKQWYSRHKTETSEIL